MASLQQSAQQTQEQQQVQQQSVATTQRTGCGSSSSQP